MSQLHLLLLILSLSGPTVGQRQGLDSYCHDTEGVALFGYSPVSYFQRNKAEPGKKEFALAHKGITYWFTDAQQQALFKKNPEHYEPAHGGWCSVMMGSSGSRAQANPEAFKIVDNRLLLFYRGKAKNGAMVDGLQIWNSRKNEQSLLRKADKQWQQILAGSRRSTIMDVGDSAVPERLRNKPASSPDSPSWPSAETPVDGTRLQAFSATYKSQNGDMILRVTPSSDLAGAATLNMITELHYPNAVLVENYILDRTSLETRYCFRPLIAGADSHYLVGLFKGNQVRGSRTGLLNNEVKEVTTGFESPVFEAQLAGYVLAAAELKTGIKGKLPCYDPITMKAYGRNFEVKAMEELTLKNKAVYQVRRVVFDEGTPGQTTLWLSDKAPYVIRRERLVSGSKLVQELHRLHQN